MMLRKFQIMGVAGSTPEIKAVRAACEQEVRTKAVIVWDSIQKAHKALGSPITETLATDLKQEASHHIEKIVKAASEPMARLLKSMGPNARLWGLESTKREVKERIDVEVDLYVDFLVCKLAPTGREGEPVEKSKASLDGIENPVTCVEVSRIVRVRSDNIARALRNRQYPVAKPGKVYYCNAEHAAVLWPKWKKHWQEKKKLEEI